MKNNILWIIGFLILPVVVKCQAVIEITNPLNEARTEEVISIPWNEVLSVYPGIDTAYFIIFNPLTKKQEPYQLEHSGESKIQNLLLLVSVNARGKVILQMEKGRPDPFAARTYCRYVPERKDDFAWENDKIAFRMYGKALENTNENAYGIDVWVKRTSRLVLNERYTKGDYHKDHGDGLDCYDVGFSLGAGDIAPFKEDSVWYPKNYRRWKILDNGPLRSTFQLEYDEWMVDSQKVSVVKTMSIDAGSQLNRVEADYTFDQSSTLPVVIGITKRTRPGTELFDERNGIMGYWQPGDPGNGTTGVGCVILQPVKNVMMEKGQLLSLLDAIAGKPIVYYRGAAWDKAGDITSAQAWFRYLQAYSQRINHPLHIVVRKSAG